MAFARTQRQRGTFLFLTALLFLASCHSSTNPSDFRPELDNGGKVATPPPPQNPALVQLGKVLFYDKVLSGNKNISCATCHHPFFRTSDGLPVSFGEGGTGLGVNRKIGRGKFIPRNAQPLFNLGLPEMTTFFWDGRVQRDNTTGALTTPEASLNGVNPRRKDIVEQLDNALAAQAMFPVASRDEMRGDLGTNEIADVPGDGATTKNLEVWARLMHRLIGSQNGSNGGIDPYRQLFVEAYPDVASYDDFNFGHAAKAIAAFETEAWTALNTPYDQYLNGDHSALSQDQLKGAKVFFGKGRCVQCHSGTLLSDMSFHSLSAPQVGPGKLETSEDRGRALVTKKASDDYRFRTPPLRNTCLKQAWMHSGAYTDITEAIRHHLNCKHALKNYDGSQLPSAFQSLVDQDETRRQARLKSADPIIQEPIKLTSEELSSLIDFLCEGLTDSQSTTLRPIEIPPASVPSGLPVDEQTP